MVKYQPSKRPCCRSRQVSLIVIATYSGSQAATEVRTRHRLLGVAAGFALTYAVAVTQTLLFGSAAALSS